jgi:hypothetical protein
MHFFASDARAATMREEKERWQDNAKTATRKRPQDTAIVAGATPNALQNIAM